MKLLFSLFAPLLIVLSFVAPVHAKSSTLKAACAFEAPLDWRATDVRWVGSCAQGRAEGYGVLRHFVNGKVAEVFYGRLEKGAVKVGAVDLGGSYKAGDFGNGQLIERDADFEGRFRGLEEASKAAKAAATRYEKEGNTQSAKYYRGQAERWLNSIRE